MPDTTEESVYEVVVLVPSAVPLRVMAYRATPTSSVLAFQVRPTLPALAVATRFDGADGGVVSESAVAEVSDDGGLTFPAASAAFTW